MCVTEQTRSLLFAGYDLFTEEYHVKRICPSVGGEVGGRLLCIRQGVACEQVAAVLDEVGG